MHAVSQVLRDIIEDKAVNILRLLLFLYNLTSAPTFAWRIDKNEINAMQQKEKKKLRLQVS